MSPTDKVDVILFQELLDDGLAESVRHATIVLTPARLALLRIGPKQVAEKAVLGHLSRSSDLLELGDGHKLGAESTMHAKDLVVDEGSDWHAIEDILEFLPDADGVTAFALVVEAIDAVDLAALVIASQEEEVLLELNLVGEEQDDSLK